MKMKRLFLSDYQPLGDFFGIVNIKLHYVSIIMRYIPRLILLFDVNHPGYKWFSPPFISFNFHYYHSSSFSSSSLSSSSSSSILILQRIGVYYYTHPFHREKTIPRVKRSYTLYEEDGHHIESASLKMDCLIIYDGKRGEWGAPTPSSEKTQSGLSYTGYDTNLKSAFIDHNANKR